MEKKKMNQKEYEDEVLKTLREIRDKKPVEEVSEPTETPKEGHKTLVEQMLCKDCNPPEEYKKTHLDLMGQKECKDCGNVDKKEEEYCSDCNNEYPKAES